MEPLTAVVAIVFLFVSLASLIAWADGLTFLAPKSAHGIRRSVELFCVEDCRVDGRCPQARADDPKGDCPLWKYVLSDYPTMVSRRPFKASNSAT